MEKKAKLPIGIENFEKLRTENFYYVDKTGLIKELLDNWGEVNLFTRPRRFGKSLNMNMLRYFFEYGCRAEIFDGLEISKEKSYCEKYMGKFPVISITLKGVDARDFEGAKDMLRSIIGDEAMRFQFLLESGKLSDEEKERYQRLIAIDPDGQRQFAMSDNALTDSLRTLCRLLCKHYGQKVILLIDEYDVPLDKAQQSGCYDEMVSLIRGLFGQALKTNDSLYFAVLTGCLRIAKESIFTGLNNFNTFSVTDVPFGEYFGFTDKEVAAMLEYYGVADKFDIVKNWYDGYRFGMSDVYCPWDVINYCRELRFDREAYPRAFWINTSGNDIIRRFIRMATSGTKRELETLIAGETVFHRIRQELTYRELYESIDNLWSVLFTTGYLTRRGAEEGDMYRLALPNLEIRQIFVEQVMEWFQEEVQKDISGLDAFCDSLLKADAAAVEAQFGAYLRRTISIRDTAVRKNRKENFYHGILLGLLGHREDWIVTSNAESGDGYSDILVELAEEGIGIVIEVKYAEEKQLEAACTEALAQIARMDYDARLRQDGMDTIIRYGIGCCRKKCKVVVQG
ncbi:AAA family ATPase [Acetatifactor aquisgranensis]|uniref:AAA family ATPase n=1 Tax=Acetatifactor aquisgranensis TaxID=2941233 RepID=UPI00203AD32E|nr:AAA family ATPase [Acetatifactor aquisgranensis]